MQEHLFGWVGIVIGLVGIFVGIVFFLINNVLHSLRALNDDVKFLVQNVEKAVEGPPPFSLNLFFTALAREAKFWGKLSVQRADKVSIASTIVTKYIQENDRVIVDSGTTIDQIPHILYERHLNIDVYTNNLLAAISVVPPSEEFKCFLLPGKVDPIYGATYNIGRIKESLKDIEATQIILAATAISFGKGPMVNVLDRSNRLFKGELVRKALEDRGNPRLIIAVDWTKFIGDSEVGADRNLDAVLEIADWRAVKATRRFVLVATSPPDSLQTPAAIRAREEIKAFCTNMEEEGMKVEICEV